MHTIYKYVLDIDDEQTLTIPAGGTILHIESVNDSVCMWVRVNDSSPLVPRRFAILGTGHTIPKDVLLKGKFIGTAVTVNGRLVWHVFDLGE